MLLAIGPGTSTALGLTTMVVAQKGITVVAGGLLFWQCAPVARLASAAGRTQV